LTTSITCCKVGEGGKARVSGAAVSCATRAWQPAPQGSTPNGTSKISHRRYPSMDPSSAFVLPLSVGAKEGQVNDPRGLLDCRRRWRRVSGPREPTAPACNQHDRRKRQPYRGSVSHHVVSRGHCVSVSPSGPWPHVPGPYSNSLTSSCWISSIRNCSGMTTGTWYAASRRGQYNTMTSRPSASTRLSSNRITRRRTNSRAST
jgi:hypothetical protein